MYENALSSIEDDAIATVVSDDEWRIENWSAEDRSAYLGGAYTLPKKSIKED